MADTFPASDLVKVSIVLDSGITYPARTDPLFITEKKDLGISIVDDRCLKFSSLQDAIDEGYIKGDPVYDICETWFKQEVHAPYLLIGLKGNDETYIQALQACLDIVPSIYIVMIEENSNIVIQEGLADFVEANNLLYLLSTTDSTVLNIGTADIASKLKAKRYNNTACFYSADANSPFAYAGLTANRLVSKLGSTPWGNRSVIYDRPKALTSTQRTNALNKNVNIFGTYLAQQKYCFQKGTCANGKFIDEVLARDSLVRALQNALIDRLTSDPKIPYTDAGLSIIESVMMKVFDIFISDVILEDYTIEMPLVRNIDPAKISARILPDIKFKARLAGAVQSIEISGILFNITF